MEIKNLFDPSKDIYRTIEKVITYGAAQEQRLKAEISEYIVTESIEEQIEKLLSKMQAAMEAGGQNEVGVWVSGFYGSGKSSFTKYLGLAFDDSITVDGQPFLRHLQDRLYKPQTKALLATVAKRFPAAVLMLDLASEQVAGATLEVVSTVLYYKVLQWAGYSRNLKVAAFERKLKKDGRYGEFEKLFQEATGELWEDYQNDELVVDSLLPELAHQMYPGLFKTTQAFTTASSEVIYLLDDRIKEIIDIVRETSGKDYILFVIDEVGQYVGSNQNKILDLQGLAENLKNIGDGKAWIVGTAQQTLTEDDPRAALNSPELYKLKDRFPIQVDLESRDIKEICYRRLLGKSPAGEKLLDQLFTQYGQALRHNTKLQDAKYYDADFSRESFINLYPFLPAHFDILLHLLGALAKSTGGIGLRSAIKVIQEILIEGPEQQPPVANRPVGWLATTVTLYDALDKDIQRAQTAHGNIYQSVQKVLIRYSDSQLHQEVAKTIAVLQILGNLPVTVHNVASLMHPAVSAPSNADAVKAAVDTLLSDPLVPLGEKDNTLRFFSEKLNDIEQERAQLPLRTADTRRIFNEALREVFNPLPAARLHGSLAVTSGLKAQSGTITASLAGDRETIQTVVEFVDARDYDTARIRLVDESRHKSSEHIIYLLGRNSADAEGLVAEIYRSRRIVEQHRNDPDQEIKEYCASQTDRAARLLGELQQRIRRSLAQGSFLFRGQTTAVDSLAQDVLGASKKQLATAAEQVFDRYNEAPERVDTPVAEKFLRMGNLAAITSQLDPLPPLYPDEKQKLATLAHRAWPLKRTLDTVTETSHAFLLSTTLCSRLGDFNPPAIEAELAQIQAEIDDIAFDLYSFDESDRCSVISNQEQEEEEEEVDEAATDHWPLTTDHFLLSWAVGVAFNRFDWRLSTGEREAPPEPNPFDPLPTKSPGMLPDGAEPFHAHSVILVDDPGHPHDLARLIEEVLERVNISVPNDVRRWLQRDFFPFHLKQYSKSRRKAPIYWPLSTTSGNYTLWVYYPSLTSQTLYTAINDFLEPKLKQISSETAALRNKGTARTREEEKQFEELQSFELELIEFRDILLKIAQNYHPNHDDGVQITASSLWPLFRHKPWQKVLKDTWKKLEKGDYDWAHLAMNYWPERVRAKCKTDKSLAIAHGLEELYEEPPEQPKKTRRRGKAG